MEGDTFDDLVKRLTQIPLRRADALRGVLASVAVGLAGVTLPAAEPEATPRHKGKGKGRKVLGSSTIAQPGELYGFSASVITVIDRFENARYSPGAREFLDRYNTLRPSSAPRLQYQLGDSECPPFDANVMPPVPDDTIWLCYTGERFTNVGGTIHKRENADRTAILAGVVYVHKFGGLVKGIGPVTCHEMMHLLWSDRLQRDQHMLADPPGCLASGDGVSVFDTGDVHLLEIAYGGAP